MTIGYLPHLFDLINVRDLDLISEARLHCSRLVVGVFSDDFSELVLGRRPVVPLVERMALVSHVREVDEVLVHDDETVLPAGARVFVVAGDSPLALPPSVGAWLLTPTRESASAVLREALPPVRRDDVA